MKDHIYQIEEEFHGRDRKTHRKERKIATAKDRSKFKKTDQDQLKKRAGDPLVDTESLNRGRVLAVRPEGILVDSEGNQHMCLLKGSLKQERGQLKNLIAVGDFVRFTPEGTILVVEERRSILSRADNLSQRKEQLIAVNIDQVLITMSVVFPPIKVPLIDRYIIAAVKGNMQPLLVINKTDLLKGENPLLEIERGIFEEVVSIYRSVGIQVFPVSTVTGEGIDELKKGMEGKTSVFSGQSGVGKSSLINAACGTELVTGEVVEKTNKGSHTTTTTQLVPIACGGFCIDTPGIKSFGIWDASPGDLQSYFTEIQECASGCRFLNCLHLQEPGCAVKEAVAEGRISPLRFDSYAALMASMSQEHRHR